MSDELTILVVGESLVDVVCSGNASEEFIGGSPLNVSVGLARLGRSPSLLTTIGGDRRGRLIAGYLQANEVRILDSGRSQRTSSAAAFVGPDGVVSYEFDVSWPEFDSPDGEFDIVHGGSIGLFLKPGADSVLELLKTKRDISIVSLDPNIRPNIIGARSRALGRFQSLLEIADIVKLSDEDAEWLYPGASGDQVLDLLLEAGPKFAAITLGARGSILSTPNERVALVAPSVALADTIGAGDSFMSALLHSIGARGLQRIRGERPFSRIELAGIGRFAAHAAAITVSRFGADPPTVAEVEGSLNR